MATSVRLVTGPEQWTGASNALAALDSSQTFEEAARRSPSCDDVVKAVGPAATSSQGGTCTRNRGASPVRSGALMRLALFVVRARRGRGASEHPQDHCENSSVPPAGADGSATAKSAFG